MKLSSANTASCEWLREVAIPGEHVLLENFVPRMGYPQGCVMELWVLWPHGFEGDMSPVSSSLVMAPRVWHVLQGTVFPGWDVALPVGMGWHQGVTALCPTGICVPGCPQDRVSLQCCCI